MIETNRFFLSITLGTALGAIGVLLTGYITAIAIPVEFFNWFSKYSFIGFAHFIVIFFTQLFGFGLIALVVGHALGKSSYWLSNSVISYLAMLSYIAILNGGGLFKDASPSAVFFSLVPLLCITLAAHRSNNKYNKRQVNSKGY